MCPFVLVHGHLSLHIYASCNTPSLCLSLSLSWLQGYSFMAPSILFKRNAVMDDTLQLCGGSRSQRPGSAAVARSAMMKVHPCLCVVQLGG